ncbi:MAG: ABC transporter ATP-binding protein [Anaerolineae bacterium]
MTINESANRVVLMTRGLRKSYGPVRALRGVDLEVRQGEIFGFLGPNGAGKTTTIRCLLDLIRPDGGTVRVLGIDPQADPVAVQARCGYLPGELRLNDNMTAERQLRFLSDMRGGTVDWGFTRELAERLDLAMGRPIKNLSKGNKQKIGVVQALMHRPDLLLLDEPTAGLDPLMQREVLGLIEEARADGATVFFSSHVISEVQAVADRVAMIRQGEIVEVAETWSLIDRALRHVSIEFKRPIGPDALSGLPGVIVLSWSDRTRVDLQVKGDMEGLINALSGLPVRDLETSKPSLEEVFVRAYEKS